MSEPNKRENSKDIKSSVKHEDVNINSNTNNDQIQSQSIEARVPIGFTLYYDKNNIPYTNEGIMQGILNHGVMSAAIGDGGPIIPGNYEEFNFVPSGATPFKGMSYAQKMKVCGITHASMTGTEVKNSGLLVHVTLKQPHGTYSGLINRGVANDLSNICVEICKLGFFDMQISNTFREQNTVKDGISRHCWGVALDINPTRGCPWFATHISRDIREPMAGTPPPWKFKKYRCGGYDRTKCIWSYDHPVVKIFEAHGWGWGGRYGDTMHFSLFNGG